MKIKKLPTWLHNLIRYGLIAVIFGIGYYAVILQTINIYLSNVIALSILGLIVFHKPVYTGAVLTLPDRIALMRRKLADRFPAPDPFARCEVCGSADCGGRFD